MNLGSDACGDGGLHRFNDKLRLVENKKVQFTVEGTPLNHIFPITELCFVLQADFKRSASLFILLGFQSA